GGEHVGFVAGGFGIQEEGFAVGDDAWRSAVFTEEELVPEHLGKRRRFGAITAGKDGDGAALALEFAGEFFDDGRLARAAEGDVADGDDLDAEGVVAHEAHLDAKAVKAQAELVNFGEDEEKIANERGGLAAALLKNDFEERRFDGFEPGANFLPHL